MADPGPGPPPGLPRAVGTSIFKLATETRSHDAPENRVLTETGLLLASRHIPRKTTQPRATDAPLCPPAAMPWVGRPRTSRCLPTQRFAASRWRLHGDRRRNRLAQLGGPRLSRERGPLAQVSVHRLAFREGRRAGIDATAPQHTTFPPRPSSAHLDCAALASGAEFVAVSTISSPHAPTDTHSLMRAAQSTLS